MKIWKIEHANKSTEGAKIAISLPANESKGIILKPGEFVLALEQQTASLDSQTRRGYVNVSDFDNSSLNLNLGEAYNAAVLTKAINETELSKLEEAEKDASEYINNEEK